MKKIYKLTPALKDNLWGGNRLRSYGKDGNADRIAESWELSFVNGSEAKLSDGRVICDVFGRDAWGENCREFDAFPTLTKFIDAKEKLSVQVHPSDDYALLHEGQYGKTEMWYVVEAEDGAGLYMGLSRKCTAEEFAKKVEDGTVEELLAFKEVRPGDVFFIPAGTVHAIGAGVLIYEIQQNSTLTYRLYDYMRRDKEGRLRELHVDKAMRVSDLSVYTQAANTGGALIGKCKYFEVEKHSFSGEFKLFVDSGSYLAISVVEGFGECDGETASLGDTYFSPAGSGEILLKGTMTVLTVRTPKQH